jgi:hypothetical protein
LLGAVTPYAMRIANDEYAHGPPICQCGLNCW